MQPAQPARTLASTMLPVAATASATPFRSTATPPAPPPTAPSSPAVSKVRAPSTLNSGLCSWLPAQLRQCSWWRPGCHYTGEQNPDFGNIFGIQCLNCHNSGVGNGYGGIHGSKVNTYIDGMGNTQTMRRFLPGLGNTKYVPGTMGGVTGGVLTHYSSNSRNPVGFHTYDYITGGVSNVTNWEQVQWNYNGTGTAASVGGGCYTLTENPTGATFEQKGLSVDGGATIPNAFGTWGGCDDHGAAQGGSDHGPIKRINRPVTY